MKWIAIACLLVAGCRAESSRSKAAGSGAPAATDPSAPAPAPAPPHLGGAPAGGAPATDPAAPGHDDIEARRRSRISKLDTDGDGVISADERAAARRARADGMRARFDRDHDGKLTPDELAKSGFRLFDPEAVDTNHDGDISVEELSTSLEQRSRAWGAGRFRLPGRRAPSAGGSAR